MLRRDVYLFPPDIISIVTNAEASFPGDSGEERPYGVASRRQIDGVGGLPAMEQADEVLAPL